MSDMITNSELFKLAMESIAQQCHKMSVDHGFWEKDRNDAEMIALMHSELSEALEGLRHGNPPSDHIPEFNSVEEELADLFIRMADMCVGRKLRIADAIIAKIKFNETRPHKHGKTF